MPALEPDQIVDVCLAGGWRKTVRVTGAGRPTSTRCRSTAPPCSPAASTCGRRRSSRAARGLARLEGVIADTKDGLRFLKTTEEVVMQRRRFFACAAACG